MPAKAHRNIKRRSSYGKGNETRIVERQRVTSANDVTETGILAVTEQRKALPLRVFIRSWDFTNPSWGNLPAGFPDFDKKGLTREEGHLLDGIKLAWMAGEGRGVFYKTVARQAVVTATIIFVLFAGRNIITRTHYITNTVSAKTVTQTIGEIIESTASAILRK